ncbi:hypothetical protein [Roseovarius sp. D0-M9]|uniref:hypothetical protein n=1 Tax=Roseovarius sp. D0-M9 TaxID=3127117 RepID=UPI00300FCCFC
MKTLRHLATASATALLMGAATLAPAQTLNFAYDADPSRSTRTSSCPAAPCS